MGEHEKTEDESGPVSGGDDAHADGDDAGDSGELSTQPGADPEDEAEIEEVREERLDPDNRPENAEVDNTDREFDAEKGLYTDSEGYEQAEEKFPPMGAQGA